MEILLVKTLLEDLGDAAIAIVRCDGGNTWRERRLGVRVTGLERRCFCCSGTRHIEIRVEIAA